jgi:hypothetical protein
MMIKECCVERHVSSELEVVNYCCSHVHKSCTEHVVIPTANEQTLQSTPCLPQIPVWFYNVRPCYGTNIIFECLSFYNNPKKVTYFHKT